MKRSQLKEAIKQVVRQVIEERRRTTKDVVPSGKKSERQVKHIKKSLKKSHPKWNKQKLSKVAIATARKTKKKKKSVNESGLTSESDQNTSDVETLANIVKKKSPNLPLNNAAHIISQLYFHKHGKPIDIAAAQEIATKHFGNVREDFDDVNIDDDDDGSNMDGGESNNDTSSEYPGQVGDETPDADATTDVDIEIDADPEIDVGSDDSAAAAEDAYSEDKELELISLIGKAVAKLLSMHRETGLGAIAPDDDSDVDSDDTSTAIDVGGDDFPPDDSDAGESTDSDDSKSSDNNDKPDDDDDGDDSETDGEIDEATYKVVSPNQTDSAKEMKARNIQNDPKVSENYKVQTGPSLRVANDSKANPKNVRNPKLG